MVGLLLKYPRIALYGALATVALGFFGHYKYMSHKIDVLETEKAAFEFALAAAARNMAIMEEDALRAAEATIITRRERDAAHAALDVLRAGRESDPESHAWGAQLVPLGELTRICIAIPELDGCAVAADDQ